jgi:hypothetical protein
MALKYHPDKNKEAGAESKFKVNSCRYWWKNKLSRNIEKTPWGSTNKQSLVIFFSNFFFPYKLEWSNFAYWSGGNVFSSVSRILCTFELPVLYFFFTLIISNSKSSQPNRVLYMSY